MASRWTKLDPFLLRGALMAPQRRAEAVAELEALWARHREEIGAEAGDVEPWVARWLRTETAHPQKE